MSEYKLLARTSIFSRKEENQITEGLEYVGYGTYQFKFEC